MRFISIINDILKKAKDLCEPAKVLEGEEILSAIKILRDFHAPARDRNQAAKNLCKTFSGLIFGEYRTVKHQADDPSQHKEIKQFILSTLYEILLEPKLELTDISRVVSYISSTLKNRVNKNTINQHLQKTPLMKDLENVEYNLNVALKKFHEKFKKEPNFNDLEDKKELAKLSGRSLESLEEMIDAYGPNKVKSLYQTIDSDSKEKNTKILLDAISNDKPIPDKIYENIEALKLFIRDLHKFLSPSETLVIETLYHPKDLHKEVLTLEEAANELKMSERQIKHLLSTAKRKIEQMPLAKEITVRKTEKGKEKVYVLSNIEFIKHSMDTFEAFLKEAELKKSNDSQELVDFVLRKTSAIRKTAGEVRFIKDRSGDAGQWAYSIAPPSKRDIPETSQFNKEKSKSLAEVFDRCMNALDDASNAYGIFAKLNSVEISPDGKLGGRGYIQNIVDIRRQLTNIIEALASISDTLYDEVHADHWKIVEERKQVEKEKEGIVEENPGSQDFEQTE